MAELRLLVCPACGGALQKDASSPQERTCRYCGHSIQIESAIVSNDSAPVPVATPNVPADSLEAQPEFPQILELVRLNRKLNAIKLLRTISGFGLKEAKDVIDLIAAGGTDLAARTRIPPGGRLAAQSGSSGCSLLIILLGAATYLIAR